MTRNKKCRIWCLTHQNVPQIILRFISIIIVAVAVVEIFVVELLGAVRIGQERLEGIYLIF